MNSEESKDGVDNTMKGLKASLREGRKLIGPFIKLSNPAVVEIFGHAGFDFVIIDTEHGPMCMEAAENLVRAARLAGVSPVIRVQSNDASLISRALDIGAEGIQVPQISSPEDARSVVKAARFAPEGERGVCRFVRAASYSHQEKSAFFMEANQKVTTIVHIEGEEGVSNLDQIIAVPGLDVIFIGPYDLSQSLGVPGEVENPRVIERIEQIVRLSREAGLVVGTFVDDVTAALKWMELGVQYISYSVDVGILYEASRNIVSLVKKGKRA